jgi:hypothetical protein
MPILRLFVDDGRKAENRSVAMGLYARDRAGRKNAAKNRRVKNSLTPLATRILKYLLKSKAAQKSRSDTLIDEFSISIAKQIRDQLNDFCASLSFFVLQNYESLSEESLLKVSETMIESFSYNFNFADVSNIYAQSRQEAQKEIETAKKEVIKASLNYPFGEEDSDSLAALAEQFFWLKGDASKNAQEKIRNILKETFKEGLSYVEAGDRLHAAFSDLVDSQERNYTTAAHTLVRQVKNIAGASRFIDQGVAFVRVSAKIDAHTTRICESLNGRIIPISHIRRQLNKLLGATSVKEKIQASNLGRSDIAIYGALPDDIGIPPYHFNCRTRILPYYEDIYEARLEVSASGGKTTEIKRLNGSYKKGDIFAGVNTKGEPQEKKVVFSHIDATGKERAVTNTTFNHNGSNSVKPLAGNIYSALRSIMQIADEVELATGLKNGRQIALCRNNIILVFDRGEVWTAITFANKNAASDYFLRHAKKSEIEVIQKWQTQNEKSAFGLAGTILYKIKRSLLKR